MAPWNTSSFEKIDVNDLKARCDLREIIVPHLENVRPVRGGEYWSACCPFHEDKSPSFLIFQDYYRCMAESCGEWGSVIDWFSHLNPGIEWWDLLELIGGDHGRSSVLPARKPVRIEVPEKEPLPEPLDLSKAKQKYKIEYPPDGVFDWIHDRWRLSRQTIEMERIAYSPLMKAVVIPVWGDNGNLITIRFRNVDNPDMGKYWGIRERNDVYGYGRQWIRNAKEAIIVMGEMTACFLHHEWGFATFSWTNGCKSFKSYLKPLLAHLNGGVIVPDVGEDNSAAIVADMLGPNWKVALLEDVGALPGEDVIDWAKRRGSREEFCDLIINRAVRLENGILPYYSRMNVSWRR